MYIEPTLNEHKNHDKNLQIDAEKTQEYYSCVPFYEYETQINPKPDVSSGSQVDMLYCTGPLGNELKAKNEPGCGEMLCTKYGLASKNSAYYSDLINAKAAGSNKLDNDSELNQHGTFHETDVGSHVQNTGSRKEDTKCSQKYSCTHKDCGKSFTTSAHLYRHVKLHSGQKPHKCPLLGCEKGFARRDNMLVHYRTHVRKMRTEYKLAVNTVTRRASVGSIPNNSYYPIYLQKNIPDDGDRKSSQYSQSGIANYYHRYNYLLEQGISGNYKYEEFEGQGYNPKFSLMQYPNYNMEGESFTADKVTHKGDVYEEKYQQPEAYVMCNPSESQYTETGGAELLNIGRSLVNRTFENKSGSFHRARSRSETPVTRKSMLLLCSMQNSPNIWNSQYMSDVRVEENIPEDPSLSMGQYILQNEQILQNELQGDKGQQYYTESVPKDDFFDTDTYSQTNTLVSRYVSGLDNNNENFEEADSYLREDNSENNFRHNSVPQKDAERVFACVTAVSN